MFAAGTLSTKWVDTFNVKEFNHPFPRDVAWLDLTMNRGNSGGPIVKMQSNSDDDLVIGIATFILNPYAAEAEKAAYNSISGGIDIRGSSFSSAETFALLTTAIANNSIGVSGCISIDHCQRP